MSVSSKKIQDQDLHVEAVLSFDRFLQVSSEWEDLYNNAESCVPMLSHGWLAGWWNSFSKGKNPYVILVWNSNKLAGALPLLIEEQGRIFRLRVMKAWVNTWVDRFVFLSREGESRSVEVAVRHLMNDCQVSWDIVNIPRIERHSFTDRCLSEVLSRSGIQFGTEDELISPYLVLPKNWEEVLLSVSPSFRQSIKRKLRAADRIEALSVKILTDTDCINPITEISLESWQHKNNTSIASRPEIKRFYESILEESSRRNELICALLEIDGEPAAFELNIICGKTLHNLKLGFKEKYSDLSAGFVLKSNLIKKMVGDEGLLSNLSEYDFMGVAEPYKLNWSKSVREHMNYEIYRSYSKGILIFYLKYKVKPYIKDNVPTVFNFLKKLKSIIFKSK